jgi:integrase
MAVIIHGRITKVSVDRLRRGQMLRDETLKGFGARRQAGPVVYFLQRRVHGKIRWITIGTHGAPWTAETARKRAEQLIGDIAGGGDPAEAKRQERARANVAEASALFLAHHGPKLKPRTREEYERLFRVHILPEFGGYKVDAITRADVSRFHAERAGIPAGANFALACMAKFMSWCEEHGYRAENSNPCRKIAKYRVRKVERYLSVEEFTRLGRVLDQLAQEGGEGVFVVAAIRLLSLTGARLNEILTLKWSFVDFQRSMLFLPDSKTGQKAIRLNTQALEILRALPRLQGNPYVLAGREEGKHLVNLQKPWRRIRALAELDDVRIHDLRHSYASMAAAAGASLPMIGKLLGHSQPQTTHRYVHLTEDPVQVLNERVGVAISTALGKVFEPVG